MLLRLVIYGTIFIIGVHHPLRVSGDDYVDDYWNDDYAQRAETPPPSPEEPESEKETTGRDDVGPKFEFYGGPGIGHRKVTPIGHVAKPDEAPSTEAFVKLAQGKYVLFFIPGLLHCDFARYQVQDDNEEKTWLEMACNEAGTPGWVWAAPCRPEDTNVVKVTDKLRNLPILLDSVYSLPETAPQVKEAWVQLSQGWLMIYVRIPKEETANLLGFRVRYHDDNWENRTWMMAGMWDRVRFWGRNAEPWPIHPCPNWPMSRIFCLLLSDRKTYIPVMWLLDGSNFGRKYATIKFQIYTFRIPYVAYQRKYSKPFLMTAAHVNCSIYDDCPELTGRLSIPGYYSGMPMEPMFGGDDGSSALTPTPRPCPRIDQLWLIFLCWTLFVLLVLVPIAYFLAKRRGYEDAEIMWIRYGQAPGNVAIGIGYSAVAWEGKRPQWVDEKKAQSEMRRG